MNVMATASLNGGDLVGASLFVIALVLGAILPVSKLADRFEIIVYYRDDYAPDVWLGHRKA